MQKRRGAPSWPRLRSYTSRLPPSGSFELSAHHVAVDLTVEEHFAPVHEIDVRDTSVHDGLPAGFTCPPVTPQVEIGTLRILAVRTGIFDTPGLGMVLGMAPFHAEVVAFSRRDTLALPLATVRLVPVAAVRAATDGHTVLHDDRAGRHVVVFRVHLGNRTGRTHERILGWDVLDRTTFWKIRIIDWHTGLLRSFLIGTWLNLTVLDDSMVIFP